MDTYLKKIVDDNDKIFKDIKNISKLEVSDTVVLEINQFLDDYYDRYTGIYLKSKDFIKQLEKLGQG